jgi:NAD-dependent dihydropyrimidine dehydrogenase PreA subunit
MENRLLNGEAKPDSSLPDAREARPLAKNLKIVRKEEIADMPPVIDPDKCIRCGKCVDICPEDVYFGSRKKHVPQVNYPQECAYCNGCVEECPVEGTIRLRIPLPMTLLYKPTA